MIYQTFAVMLMLTTMGYADVIFSLTSGSCHKVGTTATLSAAWNDPTRHCNNTYNDSQSDFETQFIYGVGCAGRTMFESYDVSTCGCTKYDNIGPSPGVTSIAMSSDCVTRVSDDFWTKITCHQ